jgi:hypothetical protein
MSGVLLGGAVRPIILGGALLAASTSAQPSGVAGLSEAVAAVRDAVQSVAPVRPTAPVHVHPAAVDLIIRWEVTSRQRYERALSRPIWPGGASGITWGVGYDAGHQTQHRIRADWSAHSQVERLASAAGLTGQRAADALPQYRDIVVPWDMAVEVFRDRSLPAYYHLAARAFGPAFEAAPAGVQGALVSLVYNRGPSMTGPSRREMREIRDVCLPARDTACVAARIAAMCRLWRGTEHERGLCGRREDEARLAMGGA